VLRQRHRDAGPVPRPSRRDGLRRIPVRKRNHRREGAQEGSIGPAKLSKAAKKTLQGPSGPRGATGATGATGPQGPAGDGKLFSFSGGSLGITGAATVASLNLPAGNYLIQGKMDAVHNGTTSSTRLECSLVNGASVVDFIKLRMAANKEAESLIFGVVPIQAAVTLAAPASGQDVHRSGDDQPEDRE
jgi:hypothetical protein